MASLYSVNTVMNHIFYEMERGNSVGFILKRVWKEILDDRDLQSNRQNESNSRMC